MKTNQRNLMHSAFLWLGLYLLLNTILGNIVQSGQSTSWAEAIPHLVLALLCFFSLSRSGVSSMIGLTPSPIEKNATMLYYLPLFLISGLSLFYGFRASLSLTDILALFIMYSGVGFMEEVIFRGLMFEGLSLKWNHLLVVFFISFTFAVGHLFSIVATNMSGLEVFLQIINAFLVGFLFVIVMAASRNLKICILAHILYNFFASISNVSSTPLEIIALTTIITFAYLAYLWKNSIQLKKYFGVFSQLPL